MQNYAIMGAMDEETLEAIPTNWLERARNCVTEDDMELIVKKAIEQARDGDRYARDFVASFVLPKDREPSVAASFKEIRFVPAPERDK
jgi:hypothetical protein